MAEPICSCWDDIMRVTLSSKILGRAIDERDWKTAREKIPQLEKLVEALESCSGIRLNGVRSRIYSIKNEMGRYDQVRASTDAYSIFNELVYDVGCHKTDVRKGRLDEPLAKMPLTPYKPNPEQELEESGFDLGVEIGEALDFYKNELTYGELRGASISKQADLVQKHLEEKRGVKIPRERIIEIMVNTEG